MHISIWGAEWNWLAKMAVKIERPMLSFWMPTHDHNAVKWTLTTWSWSFQINLNRSCQLSWKRCGKEFRPNREPGNQKQSGAHHLGCASDTCHITANEGEHISFEWRLQQLLRVPKAMVSQAEAMKQTQMCNQELAHAFCCTSVLLACKRLEKTTPVVLEPLLIYAAREEIQPRDDAETPHHPEWKRTPRLRSHIWSHGHHKSHDNLKG